MQDRGERARYSAVVGIMGLVLVPFIHLTVYLFRTLHPQPVLLKPSAPSMPPEMLRTLLSGMAAFTLLYLGFVTLRYGLARVDNRARGPACRLRRHRTRDSSSPPTWWRR